MNFISLFLADATATDGNWTLLIVLGVFIVLMLVMTIIPQKKRQKQMLQMINSLKVGSEIKTIGGLVGKVESIKDNGLIVINVGTDVLPTLINIDKVAIYSVVPSDNSASAEVNVENPEITEQSNDSDVKF